jgi:hypothetical protein
VAGVRETKGLLRTLFESVPQATLSVVLGLHVFDPRGVAMEQVISRVIPMV